MLREIDGSIAAEIILFFNDDLILSGWNTSTFDSTDLYDSIEILYGTPKESASKVYGDKVVLFSTIANLAALKSEHAELFGEGKLDVSKHYLYIEYNDLAPDYNRHEIGFCCTDDI